MPWEKARESSPWRLLYSEVAEVPPGDDGPASRIEAGGCRGAVGWGQVVVLAVGKELYPAAAHIVCRQLETVGQFALDAEVVLIGVPGLTRLLTTVLLTFERGD